MASNVIKAAAPMRVPQPSSSADFVLGSRPGSLRNAPLPRIKPEANPSRDYGKPKPAAFASSPLGGPNPFGTV
jgi:hypothetical protein